MCLGKLSAPDLSNLSTSGFNEAEAHVPRKTTSAPLAQRRVWNRFNEAEAHVPRKTVCCLI